MSETLHCVNHPNVETYLRCNKCGRPICTKCAVRTPVGYRCKSCIDAHQEIFYADFRSIYYVVAGAVALLLSVPAGWLIPRLGWYAVILGPLAGMAIAEIVRWAIRRRRGKYTWVVVCGCIIVGSLPVLPLSLWYGVYLVTATGAAYWRLRPGKRV
jgi:hypothetical protein